MRLKRERFGYLVDPWRVRSSLPKAASSDGFPCGELMRACWAATLLVLAQPSPASYATCRGATALLRVLALTHRHLHKPPCVRQPFAEISGNTVSSSPVVPLPETVPIFVCQFKGSLHIHILPLKFQRCACRIYKSLTKRVPEHRQTAF
jgi:hypothetical protein